MVSLKQVHFINKDKDITFSRRAQKAYRMDEVEIDDTFSGMTDESLSLD